MQEFIFEKTKIRVIQGDITEQSTDAIVNAANSSLMGGGGVDGAIHRKGGYRILEECRKIRETEWPKGLPTGKTVITTGGNLKARYVIHTVGPIWRGGKQGEQELLAEAYRNSLKKAVSIGIKTLAFPSISTGAYNYPMEEAFRVALKTIREFLKQEDKLNEVILVCFTQSSLQICEKMAKEIFLQLAIHKSKYKNKYQAHVCMR